MADEDFKAQFRAAAKARQGTKLTKEQIKAMKAQKAAALAAEEAKIASRNRETMPPPPPRPSASARPAPSNHPPAASYHADSQATRNNEGYGVAAVLHADPSVNQQAVQSRSVGATNDVNTNAGLHRPASAEGSTPAVTAAAGALPSGFFQGSNERPTESLVEAETIGALSFVESTGGGDGEQQQQQTYGDANVGSESLRGDVQQAFSEAVPHHHLQKQINSMNQATSRAPMNVAASGAGPSVQGVSSAIPKGFFADAAADAKARGADKPKKTEQELDKEYASFMQQLETDTADIAATTAAEGEEDAEDKEIRDEFEHYVRTERFRELREAALQKRKNRSDATQQEEDHDQGNITNNNTSFVASTRGVLEAAMITVEADPVPEIQLKKKRRVLDTLHELEVDSDGEEDSDEEDDLLDWRAKKSSGKPK